MVYNTVVDIFRPILLNCLCRRKDFWSSTNKLFHVHEEG